MNLDFRHSSREFADKEFSEYLNEEYINKMKYEFGRNPSKHPGALLLDSSLISPTQYNYKIIECGDYLQVYEFLNTKQSQKDKKKKSKLYYEYLFTKTNKVKNNKIKEVELKNLNRSKIQVQRIAKANEKKFKTFITLTFSDNVKDIEQANKMFDIWRTKIKSIFKDFCYLGVPEFQKRGAVHYHLMTNLEIGKVYEYIRRNKKCETMLLVPQKEFTIKQVQNMTDGQRSKMFDVKYWPYGFSSIFPLENIDVVGYLTKYFTKDIDNRLWGKRKYLYSMNLKQPKEILLNDTRQIDFSKLFVIEKLCDLQYSKVYYDKIGEPIFFREFKFGE